MDREEIFYSLNVEDIQTVALQEEGRELDEIEVKKVSNYLVWKSNL